MLYFLFTTGKCNLNCVYCGGSFKENVVPWKVKYDLEKLKSFLDEDDEAAIAFYGGEPLLNTDFIRKVIDEGIGGRYIIQTNGLLVNKLEPRYWMKMDTVLLSIDGRRKVTNLYRGNGVYERVITSARYLRKLGFKGDLIARMTVSERTNIFKDVTHLISTKLFDHVHWQLDLVWSDRWRNLEKWAEENYKPGLRRLLRFWINEIEKGRLHGIVPFTGILKNALFNEKSPAPPCEAGTNAFAILPNGKIIACPIAIDVEWGFLGTIESCSPRKLKGKVEIGRPCVSCEIFRFCGGRCLYSYMEREWSLEAFEKACDLTKFLVEILLNAEPEIWGLLGKGKVKLNELRYPKTNNSTEIVP